MQIVLFIEKIVKKNFFFEDEIKFMFIIFFIFAITFLEVEFVINYL